MVWWVVAAMAAKAVMGAQGEIEGSIESNKMQMSKLAEAITQINLQRAQSRQQTSKALFNSQIGSMQARSQIGLQAAASDTIGASVKDAVSTVNITTDRQQVGIRRTQAAQEEQFYMQATKAINDTHDSMDWESGSDKLFNSLLSAAPAMAGAAGGGAASGVAALASSPSGGSTSQVPMNDQSYGYDLWGNKGGSGGGAGIQSWRSYLGQHSN